MTKRNKEGLMNNIKSPMINKYITSPEIEDTHSEI